MTATRSVVLLAVVALVGLTVAPVASGAFVSAIDAESTTEGTIEQPTEEEETEPGQEVSTFMQSSAADTSNTVESEMFEAEYENADNETREALVDERADGLAAKVDSLESERDELREQEDELSESQYQARMTRLTVEISALERSVEQTRPFALDTNVGLERLATVRESVAELGGERIADFAKSLVGFDHQFGDGPFSDHLPGSADADDAERTDSDESGDDELGDDGAEDDELGEGNDGNESVTEEGGTTGGDTESPVRDAPDDGDGSDGSDGSDESDE